MDAPPGRARRSTSRSLFPPRTGQEPDDRRHVVPTERFPDAPAGARVWCEPLGVDAGRNVRARAPPEDAWSRHHPRGFPNAIIASPFEHAALDPVERRRISPRCSERWRTRAAHREASTRPPARRRQCTAPPNSESDPTASKKVPQRGAVQHQVHRPGHVGSNAFQDKPLALVQPAVVPAEITTRNRCGAATVTSQSPRTAAAPAPGGGWRRRRRSARW
jgi:hypothetical protein